MNKKHYGVQILMWVTVYIAYYKKLSSIDWVPMMNFETQFDSKSQL